MDRLQSMRVFERVVDEGGFAAAARALDLAPAAVTRLIEDLEQSLGVRLLNRTTRKLSLTQAGEVYLARIRPILVEIEEAQELAKSHTHEIDGTLRIAASPTAGVNAIAPAVAEFRRAHPGVQVEIHISHVPAEEVEHFDITFLQQDVRLDADVVVRPVFSSRMVLCGTPGYLRANGVPNQPEDLANHCVLRVRMAGARLRPLKLVNPQEGGRSVEIDAPAGVIANDLDTIAYAALEGAGLALFAEIPWSRVLREGGLQRVLEPWVGAESLGFVAAMPSRRFMPLRTRAFLDFIVEFVRRTEAKRGPARSKTA